MTLTNFVSEKTVNEMFTRVAHKYDLMNNLISLGIQKDWRKRFFKTLSVQTTDKCLDICCGTGDTTIFLAQKADKVVGLDFNCKMLELAHRKIKDKRLGNKVKLIQADAMKMPVKDESCDLVTICFGLRNVPDAGKVIEEAYRILKPGGRFAILEMSQPTNALIKKAWNKYFELFPYLALLTNSKVDDYKYLSHTTKTFLSADALKDLLEQKGFRKVNIIRLTFGSGAIHLAFK